jgi:hypothetical protein
MMDIISTSHLDDIIVPVDVLGCYAMTLVVAETSHSHYSY